ncbi:hypothetical protein [Algoriphagus halophilus]|uniref:Uncharacterized protein n=1 Tax=Algoriphagus halophilus TaxID=226505 RepID=A0A1N6DGP9_9BACT|nr:hypothetical protein [Algoriphagus halophilus]SIN69938.1 hypothetical protein SAMN05444394_0881 [Algoriphagus halophilus]
MKNGLIGSTTYFIKSFDSVERIELMENAKGILQTFTNGLLLRVFKNNQSISIPIPFSDISKLELRKGQEIVEPIWLYPMWILLKLGVRIEIARYFRMRVGEYSIDPTVLEIETRDFKLGLETNGYTFDSQENYFSKFTEIKDLKIKKPVPNKGKANMLGER